MSNSRKFENFFNTGMEKFMQIEKEKSKECATSGISIKQEMDDFIECYQPF